MNEATTQTIHLEKNKTDKRNIRQPTSNEKNNDEINKKSKEKGDKKSRDNLNNEDNKDKNNNKRNIGLQKVSDKTFNYNSNYLLNNNNINHLAQGTVFNDKSKKSNIVNVLVIAHKKYNTFTDSASMYVEHNKKKYIGFHYNVFNIIKDNLKNKYKFNITYSDEMENNYNKFIDETKNGKYDIVVGGFSYNNEREKKINYTYPLFLNSNSILHIKQDYFFKNLVSILFKITIPIIILLFLGIVFGFILNYFEPTRASWLSHIKGSKKEISKKIFRRHLLTSIASFYGQTGFLSENSTLSIVGIVVSIIIFVIVFNVLIIVQAKITTLNIELEKEKKILNINNLQKYKLLGIKGHNSPAKLIKRGANIDYVDKSVADTYKHYMKNKDKYNGISLVYTDAFYYYTQNKDLEITHVGLGIEPSSWVINKEKVQLLYDINMQLLTIKDNGNLSSICGKFIKRMDSCLE